MAEDEIAEFVAETTVVPVKLRGVERDAIVQLLCERLNVDVEAVMPWNTADAPAAVQA